MAHQRGTKNRTPNRYNSKGARRYQQPEDVHSGFSLTPIEYHDSHNGHPINQADAETSIKAFLARYRDALNLTIQANAESYPQNIHNNITATHARKNIHIPQEAIDILSEDGLIEKSGTQDLLKMEAMRILEPYQQTAIMYQATHEDDGTPKPLSKAIKAQLKRLIGKDYINNQWVKNTIARKQPPRIPHVKSVRLDLGRAPRQYAQQRCYDDVLITHKAAIGPDRYDILFDSQMIRNRYPDATSVSRPAIRLDAMDNLHYDFAVTEAITSVPFKSNWLIGFDRNADHPEAITAYRISSNGQISSLLGISVKTERTIQHKRKVKTEVERAIRKLAHLHEQPQTPEVIEHIARVEAHLAPMLSCLDRLRKAIDQGQMEDLFRHLRPGDALAGEFLDCFGGSEGFRPGDTDDVLEHKALRNGVSYLRVNPRGTTCECLCGASASVSSERVVCSDSGHGVAFPRQSSSAVKIGARGLAKAGYGVGAADYLPVVRSCDEEAAHEAVVVARRERKMASRAARGKSTPRMKGRRTASRPPAHRRVGVGSIRGEGVSCDGRVMEYTNTVAVPADAAVLFPPVPGAVNGRWVPCNLLVRGSGRVTCDAVFEELRETASRKRRRKPTLSRRTGESDAADSQE